MVKLKRSTVWNRLGIVAIALQCNPTESMVFSFGAGFFYGAFKALVYNPDSKELCTGCLNYIKAEGV